MILVLLKIVWHQYSKANVHPPYDLAISLMSICIPIKINKCAYKKIHIWMFVPIVIIASDWGQLKAHQQKNE